MKKFALVFLACFFLSLHSGAILYTNSTLLESFFSPAVVSFLFLLGAVGNIALFLYIPKLIRKLGNKTVVSLFLLIKALCTFTLVMSSSALVVAVAFVIYSSLLTIIFLEEISDDLTTGEIRGAWLTIVHLGLIIGLIVLSALSGAGDIFKPTYITASFLLLPPILFILFFQTGPSSNAPRHHHILPFRAWWRMKSVRRATLARFCLEIFYTFMTIYTPLYLHTVIGFEWSVISLMFAIALFLEPVAPLFLAIAMFSLLLVNTNPENISTLVLQLISLLMISPLALLFGKGYLKMKANDESAKILRQESSLLEKQIKNTETKTLLFTTLELKGKLLSVIDQTSYLLSDIGHLTDTQKERLLKIRQDCLDLLKSGQELEKNVDENTD